MLHIVVRRLIVAVVFTLQDHAARERRGLESGRWWTDGSFNAGCSKVGYLNIYLIFGLPVCQVRSLVSHSPSSRRVPVDTTTQSTCRSSATMTAEPLFATRAVDGRGNARVGFLARARQQTS
jgi:hypothetical protein